MSHALWGVLLVLLLVGNVIGAAWNYTYDNMLMSVFNFTVAAFLAAIICVYWV